MTKKRNDQIRSCTASVSGNEWSFVVATMSDWVFFFFWNLIDGGKSFCSLLWFQVRMWWWLMCFYFTVCLPTMMSQQVFGFSFLYNDFTHFYLREKNDFALFTHLCWRLNCLNFRSYIRLHWWCPIVFELRVSFNILLVISGVSNMYKLNAMIEFCWW